MASVCDVAVIGRGLIGSAAARHLAEAGHDTVLIGPGEPPDLGQWTGPFASHWDEGRITRVAARDRMWATVARRSIDRYHDIEIRSGIGFHVPRGVAIAFSNAAEWAEHSRACGGDARVVDAADFEKDTGIHVPSGNPVAVEGPPAGFINPRRLVAAQTRLAQRAGTVVDPSVALSIDGEAGSFLISTGDGSHRARQVLLATGAFGEDLIAERFALIRRPRTVLLAEMEDTGRLPSLLMGDIPDPRLEEVYWVPPVRYPDGRVYLKIGGEMDAVPGAEPEAVVRWFNAGGSRDEIDALRTTLRQLLPGAEIRSWDSRPCVISDTPTGHPYLAFAREGIAVALGGNGSAAKSSDELGRLAALLVSRGEWTDADLPASEFSAIRI